MGANKPSKKSINTVEKPRVLVAMSGGVDSSVSAALLQKQGYRVEGAYMQCWNAGPYCSTEIDRADALRVATALSIPFQVFDFEKQYRQAVLDYFFREYQAGRTPNPDVACNREIKFGIFLKQALALGFDYIATGHYARVEWDQSLEQFQLLAGLDPAKDQSYFLYTLGQKELAHALFPIGGLLKKEVRALAASFDLAVAQKKDSQGICFIGPVNVSTFLRQNLPIKVGDIVSPTGEKIGAHDGLAFYTIGQRQGLKINSPLPHYVVGKEEVSNQLVAAPLGSDLIYAQKALLADPSWVAGEEPKLPLVCQVSIRYHQKPQECEVVRNGKTIELKFREPQRALTTGQAAVFFAGEAVLGGATIEKVVA